MANRSVTITLNARDNTDQTLRNYERNMRNAERATREMGTQADRTGFDLSRMGMAVTGAIAGIGLMAVKDFAEEFNELGTQVKAAGARFDQLASSIGNPTDLMTQLREATLGVVDDMTLQLGAAQLLQMGLANTNEEVAKLIELAIKLKRPTQTASEAIDDFGLMLSNTSVMRLDNFGIASGKVRARIEELQDQFEGMQRDEAFKLAVLEIGQESLGRLGDAADVAGTSLSRLQTHLENLAQDAASGFATEIERLAVEIEMGLGLHPDQQAKAEAQAVALAEDLGSVLTMAFNDPMFTDALPVDFMERFVREALHLAQTSPALTNDMQAFTGQVLRNIGEESFMGGNMMPDVHMLAQATLQIQAGNAAMREQVHLTEEAATAEAERAEMLQQALETQRRIGQLTQERGVFTSDFFALEASLAQAGVPRGFTDLLSGDFELPRFMDRSQADALQDAAAEAERLLEEIERLEELEPEMFNDQQIEQMKAIAEETEKLAKEADKAAAAFEKIKLTEVFGQTSGGLAGEVGDIVLKQLRDGGATEEEIAAFQREMDLTSGRQTVGSLALQEEIAPQIADLAEIAPDMAATVARNLGMVYAEAARRGIDTNSPEFQAALREGMGISFGAGESITIQPGDTVSQIAPSVSMTPEQLMQALGVSDPRMLMPGTFDLGGVEADTEAIESFDPASFLDNFEDLQAQSIALGETVNEVTGGLGDWLANVESVDGVLTGVRDTMTDLTSKVQHISVKVRVDVDDASGILGLIGAEIANATRANGGVPPGSDGRTALGGGR